MGYIGGLLDNFDSHQQIICGVEDEDPGVISGLDSKGESSEEDTKASKAKDEDNLPSPRKSARHHEKPLTGFSFNDIEDMDQLGQLELNELDNIVTFADNIATQLAFDTTKKLKNLKQGATDKIYSIEQVKKMRERRLKMQEDYKKKKAILSKYIKSAPFTRLSDKLTFIFGVMCALFQAFFLGRYPNTFYYTYHCTFLPILIFGKWVYYKSLGWHYYMTDFCYAANALLQLFLVVYPKSDIIFKAVFLFSNGALAVAVGAFRNQLVFHKLDNLTSLALHIFPQICMWNLRWSTMPYEQTLPESERRFLSFDGEFDVMTFIVYPLAFYFLWVSIYFMINFVVAKKRIQERNYDNMYNLY